MIGDLQTARDALYSALVAVSAITTHIGGSSSPRMWQEYGQQAVAGQNEDALFPMVVIRAVPSPGDVNSSSGDRIMTTVLFRIVAAINRRAAFAAITTISEAIDGALHKKSFSVASGRVIYSRRVRPYQNAYTIDGRHYAESGGDYMMEIR